MLLILEMYIKYMHVMLPFIILLKSVGGEMVGTYSNSCDQSIVHRTSDLNVWQLLTVSI